MIKAGAARRLNVVGFAAGVLTVERTEAFFGRAGVGGIAGVCGGATGRPLKPVAYKAIRQTTPQGDLEFVVVFAGRVIEVNCVIRERLARLIRKNAATHAANCIRKRSARGLEMALHAHFDIPIPRQLCRIDDVRGRGSADVRSTGTMTPLTIDPVYDTGPIKSHSAILPLRHTSAGGMTFHTFSGDLLVEIMPHDRVLDQHVDSGKAQLLLLIFFQRKRIGTRLENFSDLADEQLFPIDRGSDRIIGQAGGKY